MVRLSEMCEHLRMASRCLWQRAGNAELSDELSTRMIIGGGGFTLPLLIVLDQVWFH